MGKRIAVIDREACKPDVANYLCRKVCPVNRSEEECVTVGADKKPVIDESLCIGCGSCTYICPTSCIEMVGEPGPAGNRTMNMGNLDLYICPDSHECKS